MPDVSDSFVWHRCDIAHAIEVLASIAPVSPVTSLNQHTAMQRLRKARSCYDHLAGRLGVAVTEALTERRFLAARAETFYGHGSRRTLLSGMGVDVDTARTSRRNFARACMDWTERRHHVAGALGAALLDRFLQSGWVLRNPRDRSLEITPRRSGNAFGISQTLRRAIGVLHSRDTMPFASAVRFDYEWSVVSTRHSRIDYHFRASNCSRAAEPVSKTR